MLRHKESLLLILLITSFCQAQCIKRTELLALAANALSQPKYAIQIKKINLILANWERCHYPKDSSYVDLSLELAKAQFRNGDAKSAINDIERIIQIYKNRTVDLKKESLLKAYYRLGFYWKELNNYDESEKASKKAVELGKSTLNSRWTSFAFSTLAYIYYSKGEYQKAIQYAEQGRTCARQAGDNIAYIETWIEKIKGLIALNERINAQKAIDSAIVVAREDVDGQYYLATLLMYNANLATLNSNIKGALVNCEEALRINQLLNDNEGIVNSCIKVGYLLYQIKDYGQAEKYYHLGLKKVLDPYVKLRLLDNVGAVYWQKKQYLTALTYYQTGLNAIPIGFSNSNITTLPKAELIRTASQKEFLLTLIQDKADTWLDYAKATNNSRERLQHALETYRVADQMIDYMRWEHTGQLSKLYWRKKTRGMYERAIETCTLLADAKQAFRFFEKSRAVMLADKLNELGARQQLSETQAKQERELREAVSAQQNQLATLTPDSARYKSVSDSLAEKQDKLDMFLKRLEVSNPTYYRYKYDTMTTKLADLQGLLAVRNASFMTYFIGDSALYLLGVTGDKTTLRRQPIRNYNQTTQQFMALLADPVAMNRTANVAQFLKWGNALYRQLLAPLKLPQGAVIVSPDGSFIPFETLSRSAREPDYLVKNYAFSYAYSARRLLRNTGSASRVAGLGERDFLGVAPVTFAATLKQVSLPGSDEALKPIADRFQSASLFTGPEATRRTFVTEATRARVIHLFTHATADTSNSEPLLYFADSTLRLSDLGDGGLTHTQLAVLAACKTGVGANQRGEGVFSLARGLAALGVPSVLTTLWSVENKATYDITNLFYQYLDQGLPKDEALQRAKQDWLATAEGANQLPNAWAGLILIGDTAPLDRPARWPWVVGGALLLLGTGGGVWWWRRRYRAKSVTSSRHPA